MPASDVSTFGHQEKKLSLLPVLIADLPIGISQKNMKQNITRVFDGIEYVPYETPIVKFVDYIIDKRIEMGRPTSITNERHWDLVSVIIKGWGDLYPEYANPFSDHMKTVRRHATRLGVSREGEAILQHQLEIPQSLYLLIKKAFPDQKWDKKFVSKFAQRFSGFMGADKL